MVNPFETDTEITEMIHLSSGLTATPDVKEDLLRTKQRGEECVIAFLKERLLVPEPDIFSTIPKLKLKTFSSMAKKVKVSSTKGTEATLKNNRNLFAQMLLLAQSRNVDMKEVLTYSLGPFPLSLSTEMGTLHKTQKSKLMMVIKKSVQNHTVDNVPEGSAIILDGMALIQATKKLPASFGEFAEELFLRVIKLAIYHKSSRVDFVIDRYPVVSIKNLEQNKRASGGLAIINIYGADQKLPAQWGKFLKHGRNKEALIRFLFAQWCTYTSIMFSGIVVYVCHDDKCHRLQPGQDNEPNINREIEGLSCDHEEADTRMLLHANHASQSHGSIVIKSPDTDVFIIMLSLCHIIQSELFFETGLNEKTRIIDVKCVQQQMGEKESKALIGFHAYTGKQLPKQLPKLLSNYYYIIIVIAMA
jgi:L-lactate utilization protein LutC